MRRLFSTTFSCLSLLACATLILFWVRSYFRFDYGGLRVEEISIPSRHSAGYYLQSAGGGLGLDRRIVVTMWPPDTESNMERLRRWQSEPKWQVHWYGSSESIELKRHPAFGPPYPFHTADVGETKRWHGFVWLSITRGGNMNQVWVSMRGVAAPYWFLVLLAGVAPVAKGIRVYRRRRRLRRSLCLKCGYDLRASEGRCPECGTLAAERVEATQAGEDR